MKGKEERRGKKRKRGISRPEDSLIHFHPLKSEGRVQSARKEGKANLSYLVEGREKGVVGT